MGQSQQAKEISKKQEVELEKEYPDDVPVVIGMQAGEELYTNLDEE